MSSSVESVFCRVSPLSSQSSVESILWWYNWLLSELISNPEHIKYFSFKCWHFNGLSYIQKNTPGSLSDLIAIRDGQLCLPPLFFSSQQLGKIIDYLCTSWLYALFLSFVQFVSCLFTYYLCWIYVLEVRINIIIIIANGYDRTFSLAGIANG